MFATLTIALVEDNELLRDELCSFLRRQGWETHGVDCGEQLNVILQMFPIDLIVLDVNLPYEDGYSIAARIRLSHPSLGIIMLTARTRPGDRVQGYKTGADVYLTKPTHTEELEAAIRNLAGRIKPLSANQLTLDRRSRRLITGLGLSCSLSMTEACLLEAMALQPNGEIGIELLLDTLRSELGEEPGRANLTVIISRLRSKVTAMDPQLNLISATRKIGYHLEHSLTVI